MTLATDDRELVQLTSLALVESIGGDGPFNGDGTVNVVIIRPCDGRGPGARIYPAATLQEAAPTFSGLPSYLNHEDPRARRAAAKMRRGPNELAGELRETVWDPTFTATDDDKHGYQPGAVVGKFMPASDLVEGLIRRIPSQMKLSVNTQATRLRKATRKDGSPGWLVEGIVNDPETCSVDLVTAAGAGGGVLHLLESLEAEDASSMTLVDALLTPEVGNYIRRVAKDGRSVPNQTPQVWATPPKSAAQRYREDLVSGRVHREAAAAREERAVRGYLRARGLDPADFGMSAEAPIGAPRIRR